MSYNEDFDEEPEVIVKKKGGLLGKVVSLLLGVVIGAHCGPGLLTIFYFCNGRTDHSGTTGYQYFFSK